MSIFDIFRKRKSIPAPWEKYYNDSDLNFDITDISMYEQILRYSKKRPDATAYQYFNKKVKYKKFIKQIDKAAISFKKLGIKKGDIVSICLPNVPEALISLYALNKLGAIANMVHPLSAEEEIKERLVSTNSIYLVMIDLYYNKIKNILSSTKVKKTIFVSAGDSMNPIMKLGYKITERGKYEKYPKCNSNYMSWNAFNNLSLFSNQTIVSDFGSDTPAVILNSGGTSGKPKNVVIQNRTFIYEAIQEGIVLKYLKEGDSCLAILPNFHGFGLSVLMHTPLTLGCYTILIPKFDANKFDIMFKKYKPTCVLGVPTLFEALINSKNEENLDLSFLKYIISGGDYLSKSLEERFDSYLKEHNCNTKITQGYGLSEALAAVCLGVDEVYKPGSIGIPLPGNHIKIIDPATRETHPYNVVGEICVHSKALMMGYLNDEKETNEVLQIHDDGHVWLHTGDLGFMDEDGFVFYKGRQKRMIITSGYNVYPSHVEEVIEGHPAVLQCTVVGVPHPYKQEEVKAFIVLNEGYYSLFVKNEIKEYCKKNLAKYMVPKEFVYRKSLPKTKLGKVDFKKLQSDNDDSDY